MLGHFAWKITEMINRLSKKRQLISWRSTNRLSNSQLLLKDKKKKKISPLRSWNQKKIFDYRIERFLYFLHFSPTNWLISITESISNLKLFSPSNSLSNFLIYSDTKEKNWKSSYLRCRNKICFDFLKDSLQFIDHQNCCWSSSADHVYKKDFSQTSRLMWESPDETKCCPSKPEVKKTFYT